MIRKVYGIALVMGLAMSLGGGGAIGCGDSNAGSGGSGGKGGSGGSGGRGGSGGIGGSAGCPGTPARCGRVLDCTCIDSTCNEDTGEWECPAGYPLDHCPTSDGPTSECGRIEDIDVFGDCSTPREPGGKYRGLGGCCTRDAANDDCGPGYSCFLGYCTSSCDTDDDCGDGELSVQGPSPFLKGSKLHCVQTGGGGFCMAGSATSCKTQSDCTQPGEVCSFVQSDRQDGAGSLKCLAGYATPSSKDVGELCDQDDPYACKHPTTVTGSGSNANLFTGCVGGICTGGCDPATANACGDNSLCYGQTGTQSGGVVTYTAGICVGADCGFTAWAFTGPNNAEDRIERDACPEGQWCNRGLLSLEGDQMTCRPNDTAAIATQMSGEECQQDDKLELSCAEGLCVQFPPDEGTQTCTSTANCPGENQICVDSNGDGTGHCATAGPPGRCGLLCANDNQCFEGSYCMRWRQGPYNVGGVGDFVDAGLCARVNDWYDIGTITPCEGEGDCTKTGDTCEQVYNRSAFSLCRVAVGQGDNGDINGALCPNGTDDECTQGKRCVLRWNAARTSGEYHCSDLSGKLKVGSPCTEHLQCRSQLCIDSEQAAPKTGNKDLCSAACRTSADCGKGMACRAIATNDNSTDATGDDALAGLCVPLGPAKLSEACGADGDCPTGTSCDIDSGQCYTPGATLGSVCTSDDRCPQGAVCEDRACVIPGCDPANDTCPVGSTCIKGLGPVYNCVAE